MLFGLVLINDKRANHSLKPIAARWAAPAQLHQQVADNVSRSTEVPGSRLIIACLLIRAAKPRAEAIVTGCM
jgi:hypothetical protein